jgi:glycosyltransferase involved in cell wall biosynthesis
MIELSSSFQRASGSMNRKPKVAIIHQPWSVVEPPVRSTDSVALWTDEVAHRLVKHCEVTSYSRAWRGQKREREHEGIQYRRKSVSVDSWVRGGFGLLDEKGLRNARKPFYASQWCYRQFIIGVIADLKRNPVDIVHVQSFSQFVPLIRRALPRAKIMLHMHAEWLARLDENMIEPRIRDADSIIFCSNYFAQQTRDAWPMYADRCHVVYNGVTLSEFAKDEEPVRRDPEARRILFVSRVSPDKGVHFLVDAFAKVLRKYPKAELKIVGPWSTLPKSFCIDHSADRIIRDMEVFYNGQPFVDQLRRRITPEAASQIEITGAISRDDLIRMYRSADIFVLPSIYPEGFGIPIVEAAACGMPAIVSRRGGMPEVVEEGKTGIITEAANVDALADAILRLLDDESLRLSMGRAAYDRASRFFTWDRIAESLMDRYDRLMSAA